MGHPPQPVPSHAGPLAWGQRPGYPPHPVSPPPYRGELAPRTVYGFQLEPGERVLYFLRIPSLGRRLFYILFGIPAILIIGVGFLLIYYGITDKKQFAYAQVVTNRRLFALDGYGREMRGMRWESVVGINIVKERTGRMRKFGVRNAAGAECMFDEDLQTVERVITQLVQSPAQREAWPEVPFPAGVE